MYILCGYGSGEGEVEDRKDKKDPGGYPIASHFVRCVGELSISRSERRHKVQNE